MGLSLSLFWAPEAHRAQARLLSSSWSFLWPNWQQQDPRGLTGAMGEAPAGPVGVKKAPRSSTDHARHGREDRRIWFRGSGVHSERITPDEHGPLTAVPTQVPGPHLHEGTNPENPRDRRGELSD